MLQLINILLILISDYLYYMFIYYIPIIAYNNMNINLYNIYNVMNMSKICIQFIDNMQIAEHIFYLLKLLSNNNIQAISHYSSQSIHNIYLYYENKMKIMDFVDKFEKIIYNIYPDINFKIQIFDNQISILDYLFLYICIMTMIIIFLRNKLIINIKSYNLYFMPINSLIYGIFFFLEAINFLCLKQNYTYNLYFTNFKNEIHYYFLYIFIIYIIDNIFIIFNKTKQKV